MMTDHKPQDPTVANLPMHEWPVRLLTTPWAYDSDIDIRFAPCAGMRFELGHVSITVLVSCCLSPATVYAALWQHSRGDWGTLGDAEAEDNERALLNGEPVVSRYTAPAVGSFWITTEGDRSATRVTLPFED